MDDARENMYLQQAAEQYAGSLRQMITMQLQIRQLNEEIDMLRLQVSDLQSQNGTTIPSMQEIGPDDVQ